MATGAAIIGAASLAFSIYGAYQENEHNKDQAKFNKKANKLNYEDSLLSLNNAQDSLKTNYDHTTSQLNQEFSQTEEKVTREVGQTRDNAEIARQMDTDAYKLQAQKEHQQLGYAKDQIVDLSKANASSSSTSLMEAGISGVRNSGTSADKRLLQDSENSESEQKAEEKIDDEILNFKGQTENYFSKSDEQKRLVNQSADNAMEDFDDYEEKYNKQLTQLKESYDQKNSQINDSKTILEKKYKNQTWIDKSNYDYATDGAWLNFVSAGLGSVNTGLGFYNNTKDMGVSQNIDGWFSSIFD